MKKHRAIPANLSISQKVPIPIIDVTVVGQYLHEMNSDRPTNEKQEESHTVEPMVVTIDLLLTYENLFLKRSQLLLITILLTSLSDFLHTVIFMPQLLVNLFMEELTP